MSFPYQPSALGVNQILPAEECAEMASKPSRHPLWVRMQDRAFPCAGQFDDE